MNNSNISSADTDADTNSNPDSHGALSQTGELYRLKLGVIGWLQPDPVPNKLDTFTCFRESGWGGILIGLIGVLVVESFAIGMFLHARYPLFSYVHLALGIYSIVWLVGDYQAIKNAAHRASFA